MPLLNLESGERLRRKLVVEIDFDHSPKCVTLRFYQCYGGENKILRMQELYNITRGIQQNKPSAWDQDDQRFFRQIWQEISKPHLIKTNLQVLKLSEDRFRKLLSSWSEIRDRFIEKKSQKPFSASMPKAHILFELDSLGEESRITAMVSTQGGTRYPYHTVDSSAVQSESIIALKEGLFELEEYPIKKEILDRFFACSDPISRSTVFLSPIFILIRTSKSRQSL